MAEDPENLVTQTAEEKIQPPWVAIATAVIAAFAAVTAAEIAHISKEGELELSAQEKQYQALDRAVDPKLDPEARKLVLRFLSKVPKEERLRGWAKTELTDVETQLKAATKRIAELEKAYTEAAETADQTKDELDRVRTEGEQLIADAAERGTAEIERERAALLQQKAVLEQRLRDAERKQITTAAKLTVEKENTGLVRRRKPLGLSAARISPRSDCDSINIHHPCYEDTVMVGKIYDNRLAVWAIPGERVIPDIHTPVLCDCLLKDSARQ